MHSASRSTSETIRPSNPDLRASDAERQRVADRLSEHAASGRLSAEELEERVSAALAARTLGDLEPLLADLPEAPPARGPRRRRGFRVGDELRAYLAVMALLVSIWALTGAGYFWPVWPALGWGVALLIPCGGSSHKRHRRATA